MSQVKVDSIYTRDGLTDLCTVSNGVGTGLVFGRRNLIINGAMQVWQRGTSGSATDNYASADRWKIARGTLSQQTFTAGSELGQNRNYANFDFSSASFAYVMQHIEDISTVAGKTITVSFYIKSDTITTVWLRAFGAYGSGGSSATTDKSYEAISITSSWQRITKTFNVTSLSGKTVGAGSYYGVGIYGSTTTASTGDFDIWGFQVEVGSVATPFEHRSYGEELALCRRYYKKNPALQGNFINSTGGFIAGVGEAIQTMRALPTLTLLNGTDAVHVSNISNYTATGVDAPHLSYLRCSMSSTPGGTTPGHFYVDKIAFDAEL